MSTFPPYSETFVMREIRELRKQGWDIRIGCLRPLHRTPAATGFEDLEPFVIRVRWLSLDILQGLLLFCFARPGRILECIRLIVPALTKPISFAKLSYLLLASVRLAYRYRESPITLIRAHFLHSEVVGACFLSVLLQAPYSVTVYTTHVLFPESLIRRVVQGARFVVADTSQIQQFLQGFAREATHIHVVTNSVDISEFPKRCLGAVGSVPVILAVGRLDPKKGFHVLLEACALLRDRGLPFKAVVVGEGSERLRLTSLRKKLHLEDKVELLGRLSFEATKSWFYRSTLLAMPSVVTPTGDTDGLPTVVIEAMASGLPVVGTRIGAIPEAVLDGKTGFLVPANEPKLLADQMERLLTNESLRIQFGAEGRRRAVEKFDLPRKAEILSALIDRYCSPETHA